MGMGTENTKQTMRVFLTISNNSVEGWVRVWGIQEKYDTAAWHRDKLNEIQGPDPARVLQAELTFDVDAVEVVREPDCEV